VGDEALVAQCIQIAQAHGLESVLLATASPIARDFAVEQGIPVVGHGDELAAGLDEHPADVLLSIANLRIIRHDVLARVGTAINYHDGPLPAYAGLNVTTWAILGGEHEHAITWHLMTDDVDGGEVVTTETFSIADDETAFSLNARCYEAALSSFPRIAAALAAGDLPTTPQPAGERRMFTRHQRPARLLDLDVPARDSARAVRAVDLGHRIPNTVGCVRLVLGDEAYVVSEAQARESESNATAGTVVSVDSDGVAIATSDGDLVVRALTTPDGTTVDVSDLFGRQGLAAGDVVPAVDPSLRAALTELEPQLAADEKLWLDRLASSDPSTPTLSARRDGPRAARTVPLPSGIDQDGAVAAVALWLARTTGADTAGFGVTVPSSRGILERLAPLARPAVVAVPIATTNSFDRLRTALAAELDVARSRTPVLSDAIGRDPRTRGRTEPWPVLVELDVTDADRAEATRRPWTDDVVLRVGVSESALVLDAVVDEDDPDELDRMCEQIATLLAAAAHDPAGRCDALAIVGPGETALLDTINDTALDHDR
jgi:methionyl-tRNA formyltransferase